MRTMLFAALLLASAAHAEVFTCPDAYPKREAPLTEMPYEHKGSGIIRGAPLSGAYVYSGKLHHNPNSPDAIEWYPKVIKGGWQTENSLTPDEAKWLVCLYGGDGKGVPLSEAAGPIEWWEQIDPNMTRCVLKVMKITSTYRDTVHFTATATCN